MVRNLLPKKADRRIISYSLLFTVDSVAAAAWYPGRNGKVEIVASSWQPLAYDTWEEREKATDSALVSLETKTHDVDALNVVFGLPYSMLTPEGDMKNDVRTHIKKLVRDLNLTPLGFVAFDQALAYTLKQEDGVPASVILLGISGSVGVLTVYKVGHVIGRVTISISDTVASEVEAALKSFKNLDVLPSRILLYGGKIELLESLKRSLMQHPWTTKMNFVHFPKIDVLSTARFVAAVCFAGASQLSTGTTEKTDTADKDSTGTGDTVADRADATQVERAEVEEASIQEEEGGVGGEEEEDEKDVEEEEEERQKPADGIDADGEDIGEPEEPVVPETEHNVVMVDPEKLGFQPNIDVLEHVVLKKKTGAVKEEPMVEPEEKPHDDRKPVSIPKVVRKMPDLRTIARIFSRIPMPAVKGILPIGAAFVLLIAIGGLSYWTLPKATVTIYELPMEFTESLTVTVDPDAQTIDALNHVIPGSAQSKSVSGEKTIAVTGKKKVGDPAKGTVTIYNKSLSSRTFQKGTILSAGTLRFTLDSDVTVASASENLVNGTVTFGKENAAVTAAAIGTQGNLPVGSEFAIQDVSSSVAVSRNDQEFTGGTSREVTVVTRDDQDILVGELTKELVEKAKEELAASVTGGEKLIDSTVQTKVTEKTFAQELDQEATSLEGNITVTVTGISYNEADVVGMLDEMVSKRLPEGYALHVGQGVLETTKVTAQKNGTIRFTASYKTVAAAKLNLDEIKQNLSGKSLSRAQEYLQGIHGVAAASFEFRWTPGDNRMPLNKNNISVSVAFEGT